MKKIKKTLSDEDLKAYQKSQMVIHDEVTDDLMDYLTKKNPSPTEPTSKPSPTKKNLIRANFQITSGDDKWQIARRMAKKRSPRNNQMTLGKKNSRCNRLNHNSIQDKMVAVFSHMFQKRFSQVNEDVATGCLAFILHSSENVGYKKTLFKNQYLYYVVGTKRFLRSNY